MQAYIVRRLLLVPVMLFVISLFMFWLMYRCSTFTLFARPFGSRLACCALFRS